MATANIDLSDGTKVMVDGSPEEIARILNLYRGPISSTSSALVPVARQLIAVPGSERRSQKATGPKTSFLNAVTCQRCDKSWRLGGTSIR
jgi:hypothetical protein